MSNLREVRTAKQAEQEDLFFGQTVILWARWSVIVAGIVLVLWTSSDVSLLTRTMPFFLVLMAVNFFLHGRYVMGRPLNRTAVVVATHDAELVTSVADRVMTVDRGVVSEAGPPPAVTAVTLEPVPA